MISFIFDHFSFYSILNEWRSFVHAAEIAAFKFDRIGFVFVYGNWHMNVCEAFNRRITFYLSVSINVMQVATIFTAIMNLNRGPEYVFISYLMFRLSSLHRRLKSRSFAFVFESNKSVCQCY